jgi:hypothetical protein
MFTRRHDCYIQSTLTPYFPKMYVNIILVIYVEVSHMGYSLIWRADVADNRQEVLGRTTMPTLT